MKKFSYVLGMMAMSAISLSLVAGCSSEDPANPMTTGGAGGGGGAPAGGAGGGGVKAPTGMQLTGPSAYTILSAENAVASATPAPAYYGTVCVTCHGPAGQGAMNYGPEIRHTPTAYSNYVVRTGRTGTLMGPYKVTDVSDADVAAIQMWLSAQPKPTTGQGLYLDYCANCHGPTGGGGLVPYKASGLPTATITATVRAGVGADPAVRNAYMPAFGADMLTDAELTLIAQFLGGT
jgi:mono/diheme cytochrome c family protein